MAIKSALLKIHLVKLFVDALYINFNIISFWSSHSLLIHKISNIIQKFSQIIISLFNSGFFKNN